MGGAHPITKVCKSEYHIGPEYIFAEINHTHNTWITQGEVKAAASQQSIEIGVSKLAQETEGQGTWGSASELDGCL